ncbi:MAG: hypothetical protein ABW168_22375 [Sedimenticola sp.]
MNKLPEMLIRAICLTAGLCLVSTAATAFDSGSTGVDGAFSPTVNTTLQVPPDGIFNFTEVSIPSGVTVGFNPNTSNTPVTILASGNVSVAGTLHVNGHWATNVGASGDGNVGDDGIPGKAVPGGYAGGRGGVPGGGNGQHGLGPGGGTGGYFVYSNWVAGGGGGGFGSAGSQSVGYYYPGYEYAAGGPTYGSSLLLPLVGGSGGGGGRGGAAFHGSGGGAGGGAILVAATGALRVTGAIYAVGGNSGASGGSGSGGTGGGGSGGAIRLVATRIEGNGTIQAAGGATGSHPTSSRFRGGNGGNGRIRLEADSITRTAATNPVYSFGQPTTVFVSGLPSLRITSVAGVEAPAYPTGSADIVLPADTPNPVTVTFESTGVPVGNTIKLSIIGATSYNGSSAVTPALVGTTDLATASVDINLPSGPTSLLAQTTYTLLTSQGDQLAVYTEGERVEKVRLSASMRGAGAITLITVSGKEYELPSRLPGMPATAG